MTSILFATPHKILDPAARPSTCVLLGLCGAWCARTRVSFSLLQPKRCCAQNKRVRSARGSHRDIAVKFMNNVRTTHCAQGKLQRTRSSCPDGAFGVIRENIVNATRVTKETQRKHKTNRFILRRLYIVKIIPVQFCSSLNAGVSSSWLCFSQHAKRDRCCCIQDWSEIESCLWQENIIAGNTCSFPL